MFRWKKHTAGTDGAVLRHAKALASALRDDLVNRDRKAKFLIRRAVGMGMWLSGAPASHTVGTKGLKTSLGMAGHAGLHNCSPEL